MRVRIIADYRGGPGATEDLCLDGRVIAKPWVQSADLALEWPHGMVVPQRNDAVYVHEFMHGLDRCRLFVQQVSWHREGPVLHGILERL